MKQKWPGNPDLFEFPDWICQNCGLHEPGGLGQPGICAYCQWNKWEQEDLSNEYRRVPPHETLRSRIRTDFMADCPMHASSLEVDAVAAFHIGYAMDGTTCERLFECPQCSHRFIQPDARFRPPSFERYRKVDAWDIPKDVLFGWLEELGWSNVENFDAPPLVEFMPISDPEDSYFNVNGSDNDCKTTLAQAVKKAYFKLQDKLKEERRKAYRGLRKEFEELQKEFEHEEG